MSKRLSCSPVLEMNSVFIYTEVFIYFVYFLYLVFIFYKIIYLLVFFTDIFDKNDIRYSIYNDIKK